MDEVMMKLGDRLREYRERGNMTQDEMGKMCNTYKTFISSVERGMENITMSTLFKISDALEVSVSELMDGLGPESRETYATKVHDMICTCPEKKQKEIYDIVSVLLAED